MLDLAKFLETKTDREYLYKLAYETIKELETDQGILASGRNEVYGCIFGRDSLITSLKLLRVYRKTKNPEFLFMVKKVLLRLAELQGREINIESGEQPGKCIHEYRPDKHDHLTKNLPKPWFVYPDMAMRNYDTVDATSLFLITIQRYWQLSKDQEFLDKMIPHIDAALDWIFEYGDSNEDGLIDYQLPPERKFGGLLTQNWMDSVESVFLEEEELFEYPLAPVEVQAYTFLALKLWGNHFQESDPSLSKKLHQRASSLKNIFNERFSAFDLDGNFYLAYAIDNQRRQLRSIRSNMGHILWASMDKELDGNLENILDENFHNHIVKRLLMPDIFVPTAGVRTLSSQSKNYTPNSYHNGSIWPHDNSLIWEGFENHGFMEEAQKIKAASLAAYGHFKTPLELFVYHDGYLDYSSAMGQVACKKQAWSAAALLDLVS